MNLKQRHISLPAALVCGGLFLAGCSNSSDNSMNGSMTGMAKTDALAPACNLRVQLVGLLRQHVALAAATTGAALGSRPEELLAARATLDQNSKDLARAFADAYDTRTSTDFYAGWQKHIDALVSYTRAVAANNADDKRRATEALLGYQADFSAFIEKTTGGRLKRDPIGALLHEHVAGLMMIVDLQAKKDFLGAYSEERHCETGMEAFGTTLANAVAEQFPNKLK